MALHILNFSIDNPHTLRENDIVDEDFEEVDSVVELVLEDVIHIENAIPEHHTKSPVGHKLNIKKTTWTCPQQEEELVFESVAQPNFRVVLPDTFYQDSPYYSPYLALFSPPPEA
ncbi:hypothetical protein HYN59_03545 [Flavobacterium album]|uniref:Uncharacterized protein n=1 Tax=Flavobacterium album TaxID=2175091 RepID=A0A2S1QVJ6_9FLAO|nr:hypothetical protein [Flavobacterium album]AWH84241.1 hypothetical protein HYN59_03545 [Flavobacterium album]